MTKPHQEEKTAPTASTTSTPSSVVSSGRTRLAYHPTKLSLDEQAILDESRDTVETDSIQLGQRFDESRAVGKVDRVRASGLERMLSQRMERDKFESRFLKSEERGESVLNRGSRLNTLLAVRPSKERLEQMNVIKRGSSSAHSNPSAAQTSLSAEQRKNRLAHLLHKRPDSLDLTKRNILLPALDDGQLPPATLRDNKHALGSLLQARPAAAQLQAAKILHSPLSPTSPRSGGGRVPDVWQPQPVEALQGKECAAVGCGFGHTLALRRSGDVWAFGNVEAGRLGRGQRDGEEEVEDEEDELGVIPHPVRQLHNVASVSAGDNHSCAVTASGELWAWGSGQWGRLGNGEQTDVHTPVRVSVGRGEAVRQVSCGAYHTVVLTQTRNVYSFGWNKQGRVGIGKQSSLLVLSPTLLASLSPSVLSSPVAGVAAGQQHTVAWSDAGGVLSWGAGSGGCLGHGDEKDVWEPRGVQSLQGVRVTQCAVGAAFSLAASDQHRVYSWGHNRNHELARDGNPLLPAIVTLPPRAGALRSLVCGKSHALLIAEGGLYSWGMAARGVLGRGEDCDGSAVSEVKGVAGRAVAAAASWSHSAVVTADGRTYTWGSKTDGKLGYE